MRRLSVAVRRYGLCRLPGHTRVLKVLSQVQKTFNPSTVYLGGGNASKLKLKSQLPDGVRVGWLNGVTRNLSAAQLANLWIRA